MSCLIVRAKLSAFRDGALSKETRWRIRGHLKECPSCAAELEALEAFLVEIGGLEAPPAPDHLWDRIAASAAGPSRAPRRPRSPGPAAALLAGFLLMALVVVGGGPTEDPATHYAPPSPEERILDEIDYDTWYLTGERVARDRTPLLPGIDGLEGLLERLEPPEETTDR